MDTFSVEDREYAKEWDLPAHKDRGWVHEVEVPMREGEALAYESLHGGEGVTFNIHSHKGRETTYHAKGSDLRMAGTFRAPFEGKYYMMWENGGAAAVHVQAKAVRKPATTL